MGIHQLTLPQAPICGSRLDPRRIKVSKSGSVGLFMELDSTLLPTLRSLNSIGEKISKEEE